MTDDLRYVFVTLPRCPACNSSCLKVYGHQPNAECLTQYTRCRDCDHKFLTVWEDSFNAVENRQPPPPTMPRSTGKRT